MSTSAMDCGLPEICRCEIARVLLADMWYEHWRYCRWTGTHVCVLVWMNPWSQPTPVLFTEANIPVCTQTPAFASMLLANEKTHAHKRLDAGKHFRAFYCNQHTSTSPPSWSLTHLQLPVQLLQVPVQTLKTLTSIMESKSFLWLSLISNSPSCRSCKDKSEI